ncbi:MAG: hypothetical protein IT260_05340 [Saprospiraceae bacterium]|nr:hypothetical protein [Saprospiraceae bacterium]
MTTSKLIQTLRCLDAGEILRLGQYLQSPYFVNPTSAAPLQHLFQLLQAFHPAFPEVPELAADTISHHLFGPETPAKSRLDKLMTRLHKEVRQFIVLERRLAVQSPLEDELHLARFFRSRHYLDAYQRLIDRLRQQVEQPALLDAPYFQWKYELEEEIGSYQSWFNHRTNDLNVPATLDALDTWFMLKRLELVLLLLSQSKTVLLHAQEHIQFMKEIEGLVAQPPFAAIPLLQVYYQAYHLLSSAQPDRRVFLQFKTLLEQEEPHLPADKVKDLQALARNYCIQEFNGGNPEFFAVTFDLYAEHLAKGYLYREGLLHAVTVKNLVTIGLRQNMPEWVRQFLEEHKNRITGISNPAEVYRFNMALYKFYIADYDAAYDFLDDTYEDILYKIAAKRLEIKILFETESPILESRLQAFHIFIFRMGEKKLSANYLEGNKQFIGYLRRLLRPNTLGNKRRIARIRQDLDQATALVEKDWLLSVVQRQR